MTPMIQNAVLDANVLYPAPLRDLLMSLATRDLYNPLWSETIHDEWIRNVLKNLSHVTAKDLARTKSLMLENVPNAMVTGYENLIPDLTLPDPNDRHVLAIAIQANADLIVTNNLKDFPTRILERYGVDVVAPDAFVLSLANSRPDQVLAALRKQRSRLQKPPSNQQKFLDTLLSCGLKDFVRWVEAQNEPI